MVEISPETRRKNAKAQALNAISALGWEIYERGTEGLGGRDRAAELETLVHEFVDEFPGEKLTQQIEGEREENRQLRNRIRVLEAQVQTLEGTVKEQRRKRAFDIVQATTAALQEVWNRVDQNAGVIHIPAVLSIVESVAVNVRAGLSYRRLSDHRIVAPEPVEVWYPQKLTGKAEDLIIAIVPNEELTNERIWDWLVEDVMTRLKPHGRVQIELAISQRRHPINPVPITNDTKWRTAPGNRQQLRHPHEHENWQVDAHENGWYCRACGQQVEPYVDSAGSNVEPADPTPRDPTSSQLTQEQLDNAKAKGISQGLGLEVLTTGTIDDDLVWQLIAGMAGLERLQQRALLSGLEKAGVIETRPPQRPKPKERVVRLGKNGSLPPGNYRIQLTIPGDTHPDDILIQGPKSLVDPTAPRGARAYFKVLGVSPDHRIEALEDDLPEAVADHQNERPKRDDDPAE